jgi:hypothetical protein
LQAGLTFRVCCLIQGEAMLGGVWLKGLQTNPAA